MNKHKCIAPKFVYGAIYSSRVRFVFLGFVTDRTGRVSTGSMTCSGRAASKAYEPMSLSLPTQDWKSAVAQSATHLQMFLPFELGGVDNLGRFGEGSESSKDNEDDDVDDEEVQATSGRGGTCRLRWRYLKGMGRPN